MLACGTGTSCGHGGSVADLGGLGQRPDTEVFAAGDVLAGKVVPVDETDAPRSSDRETNLVDR
jgi:hypothetical protein